MSNLQNQSAVALCPKSPLTLQWGLVAMETWSIYIEMGFSSRLTRAIKMAEGCYPNVGKWIDNLGKAQMRVPG